MVSIAFTLRNCIQYFHSKRTQNKYLPLLVSSILALTISVQLVHIGRALFADGTAKDVGTVNGVRQSIQSRAAQLVTSDAGRIAAAHLFGVVEEADTAQPLNDSSLTLTGTLASNDSAIAFAIVGDGLTTRLYRVGDALPGNATLASVYPTHIVVERSGELFAVSLSLASGTQFLATNVVREINDTLLDFDMDGKQDASPELPQIRPTTDAPIFVEQVVPHRDHD